ncbi:hypothetical protein [Undibacterium sp. TS12]|uniref:hypothetical protein n=1 Tax=Undibacterium sp. TS12 TaxID=2908202 RepID=UPI001F4C654B|nr:hypothetical protein [Undibacterium sp. TS12]MCH8621480.1 hypothetical protein [Undibacterium sp. TS12]
MRDLLSPWGELRPQAVTDWQGEIPLPAILANFYAQIGPWGEIVHEKVGPTGLSLNAGGNPVDVPVLKNLWSRQACYRWHGNTGQRLPEWQDHWLVVATEGSNPFMLDTVTGQVYFALAGGKPDFRLFAPDLLTAFAAIACVANTMRDLGELAFDDTYELTAAARAQVTLNLDKLLAGIGDAREMVAAWRWYC